VSLINIVNLYTKQKLKMCETRIIKDKIYFLQEDLTFIEIQIAHFNHSGLVCYAVVKYLANS